MAEKPLQYFKLLKGRHTQMEAVEGKRGKNINPVRDHNEKIIGYNHTYSALIPQKVRRQGQDVVELLPVEGFTVADQYVASTIDLVARCGAEKFAHVHKDEATQYDEMPIEEASPSEQFDDSLNSMTLAELRQTAKQNNIDLKGATDKQSIIDLIRAASVPA